MLRAICRVSCVCVLRFQSVYSRNFLFNLHTPNYSAKGLHASTKTVSSGKPEADTGGFKRGSVRRVGEPSSALLLFIKEEANTFGETL